MRSLKPAVARERLVSYGAQALSNGELLTVLTGSPAAATPLDLADGALRALVSTPYEELRLACTPRVAAQLLAFAELTSRLAAERLQRGVRLQTAAAVYDCVKAVFQGETREVFLCLALDAQHQLIRVIPVSTGTQSATVVHPCDIFGPLLRCGAAAAIVAHNHPSSGDPTPSADDLELTRRLQRAAELVGIRLLDHVVVGDGCFASLAERGGL